MTCNFLTHCINKNAVSGSTESSWKFMGTDNIVGINLNWCSFWGGCLDVEK